MGVTPPDALAPDRPARRAACPARLRASVIAVSRGADVAGTAPSTVMRRAPSPPPPSSRASASIASTGTPVCALRACSIARRRRPGPGCAPQPPRPGSARPRPAAQISGTSGSSGSARSSSPVRTKPVESANMASAATSTVGSFFGQDGVLETDRARDDARIRRRRADAVACGRLAILGEIGFEQIALRLGIALERAQLHVLLVGRGRLPLELIETGAERRRPCALGELGVVLERARQPIGLARASAARGRRSAPATP